MRITRYSDYSLRVLIFLALRGEQLSTIREIAESYRVSKNHLMKVCHDLQQRGVIETVRGKGGGMRLRKRPHEINIGALLRHTESELNLVECFGPDNECIIDPDCALKGILAEALRAFFRVLDSHTLADLVEPKHQPGLCRLLGIEPAPTGI